MRGRCPSWLLSANVALFFVLIFRLYFSFVSFVFIFNLISECQLTVVQQAPAALTVEAKPGPGSMHGHSCIT